MFKILLMYPRGFIFIKTVYEHFDNLSYLCKSSFTRPMYNIREGYDVIFPNCVKYVRIHAINHSVKLCRRLIQNILDLLSCDLTTSKDQNYRAESA